VSTVKTGLTSKADGAYSSDCSWES